MSLESIETARRTAAGLHRAGLMQDAEMAKFDAAAEKARQETVADIRAQYRELRYLVKSRIAIGNRTASYIRLCLGWSKDLPEAERDRIAKAAAKAIKDRDPRFAEIVDASDAAMRPFEASERRTAASLRKLAGSLPAWASFGQTVSGFGSLGLAVIIGEAGNLCDYESVPKLWKRLGLGMVGDKQQGRPGAHATAADWIEHGYSKERRAAIFAYIGEPLLKKDNPYRTLYLRKKAQCAERGMKKLHAHRYAHRYATKMLIKHLWREWRAADLRRSIEMTMPSLSAARIDPLQEMEKAA